MVAQGLLPIRRRAAGVAWLAWLLAVAPAAGATADIRAALVSATTAAPTTVPRVPAALPPAHSLGIDLARLGEARQRVAQQGDARLTLTLNPGDGGPPRPVTVLVSRSTSTPRGYALAGGVEGEDGGRCVLVVNGSLLAGTLWLPDGVFSIGTVAEGDYVATRVPRRRLPLAPPRLPPPQALPRGAPPPAAASDDGGMSQVDVLVLWSPAARTPLGGLARTEAKVDLFVAAANDAYQQGGVAQRLELVGAAEIDYRDETVEHIDLLPDAEDGFLDQIHELRDSAAADIVTLVGELEIGGIAILMAELHPEFASFAFNMVDARVPLPTVYAHELGHNMGLQHDRFETLRRLPPSLPPDAKLALFPYSFGYVNQRAFRHGSPCFHTIMAYPDQCDEAGRVAIPLPLFSHPEQRFPPPDGDPVGAPEDQIQTGFLGPAHAVRSLNETRRTVAAFRDGSAGCRYDLAPASGADPLALQANGDSLIVEIATDAGCAWRAHHQEDFLAIVGTDAGTGPGAVEYQVRPNPGVFRAGVLSIAARTIAVRQHGAVAPAAVCDRTPAVRDAIVVALGGAGCAAIDVFALAEVTALEIVDMEVALRAEDLQGLANLSSLAFVGSVRDLAPLAALANLRQLSLADNDLADIGALAGLGQLQELGLSGNRVADLSPLRGLTRLTLLELNGNLVTSLSPLAGLTELLALLAQDNAIADLSPLADLPTVSLLLANNAIADAAPLLAMRWLRFVDLRGNPLSERTLDVHIPALQARGVAVLFDEPAPAPRKAWWWHLLRLLRDDAEEASAPAAAAERPRSGG